MKQKIIGILKLVGVYIALYLIATLIFIGLFHTPILKNMHVLMYRGTVFIVIAGIIAASLMLIIKSVWRNSLISIKDAVLLFFGCCSINMAFFTLVPVTVERSVSVFMLSYMDENSGREFTQEEIEDIFVEVYVKEYGAFEKRFNEQLVTGSIYENGNGTYSISKRGHFIVSTFRLVANWFNTDQRLVYPTTNSVYNKEDNYYGE